MFFIVLIPVCIAFFFYLLLQFVLFAYGTFFKRGERLERFKPKNGLAWSLVTGASDGIGLAYAHRLAAAGFNILMHGRNAQKLQNCIDDLKSIYPSAQFVPVIADAKDVSAGNVRKLVDAVADKQLCILVNNVGIAQNQKMVTLEKLQAADIQDTILVNCVFTTLVTHALLPKLTNKAHRCAIINIGSIVGFAVMPAFSVYAATKAYLHSFSNTLSAELVGQNVDVLCVSPGYTQSNMTKEKASMLVSTAESVAQHSLNRIGSVDIVPGIIAGVAYCSIALSNLVPVTLLPWIMNFGSRLAPRPRAFAQ